MKDSGFVFVFLLKTFLCNMFLLYLWLFIKGLPVKGYNYNNEKNN